MIDKEQTLQAGPSGRGTQVVDIKLKVPPFKCATLISMRKKVCARTDGTPCTRESVESSYCT